MGDLSFTQEYLLCALYPKGRIPILNWYRITACIVAGGLLELLHSHIIAIDAKKKVVIERDPGQSKIYLEPLINNIQRKPMTAEDIAFKYVFSLINRPINELIRALGEPMQEKQCVTVRNGGLFGNKTLLIPEDSAVLRVVEKIRAEFLEDGALQEETIVLAVLLQKSSLIKNYFSKFESRKLKERLKEIKKSESGALIKEIVDYIDIMFAVFVTPHGCYGGK